MHQLHTVQQHSHRCVGGAAATLHGSARVAAERAMSHPHRCGSLGLTRLGRRAPIACWLLNLAAAQQGWRNGNWVSGPKAPDATKELWAARPPLRGPAPLRNRRPVVRNATAPPFRTPAPLGPPLWSAPAHRFRENVITGLALNYRIFSHRARGRAATRRASAVRDRSTPDARPRSPRPSSAPRAALASKAISS